MAFLSKIKHGKYFINAKRMANIRMQRVCHLLGIRYQIRYYTNITIGDTCAICMDNLCCPHANSKNGSRCELCQEPRKVLRVAGPCKHIFHAGCIVDWLDHSKTCPMCRARIKLN